MLGAAFRFHVLALPDSHASFNRRGFYKGDPDICEQLEQIGRVFINGYNLALRSNERNSWATRLEAVQPDLRGFAFEGAAMALALLDNLTPWNHSRLRAFLTGPAQNHLYMVHVGVGWVIGRLPWLRHRLDRFQQRLDPLLKFLAIDGYGFHQGYFHWQQYVRARKRPSWLSNYQMRVFDQGLGRSLWFVECGNASRLAQTINSFEVSRRADLWSGVGLAATYTGIANHATLQDLRDTCGDYKLHLAQGSAFAAKTRQRAGNLSVATDHACQIFCRVSAVNAARIVDNAMHQLPAGDPASPSYEIWRKRIRKQIANSGN